MFAPINNLTVRNFIAIQNLTLTVQEKERLRRYKNKLMIAQSKQSDVRDTKNCFCCCLCLSKSEYQFIYLTIDARRKTRLPKLSCQNYLATTNKTNNNRNIDKRTIVNRVECIMWIFFSFNLQDTFLQYYFVLFCFCYVKTQTQSESWSCFLLNINNNNETNYCDDS